MTAIGTLTKKAFGSRDADRQMNSTIGQTTAAVEAPDDRAPSASRELVLARDGTFAHHIAALPRRGSAL